VRAGVALAAAVLALSLGACGSSDDQTSETVPSQTVPRSSSDVGGKAPEELVGTYAMTLKHGDIPPDPAPELVHEAEHWTLKISNTGAIGGPSFTITNDTLGPLENTPLGVQGDRVLLHQEECAVSAEPVESIYRWKLDGDTLTFTKVVNGCDDDVVKTLLTAEPWQKSG
jgi:hypothetical protein